jgi:hypothetical protein
LEAFERDLKRQAELEAKEARKRLKILRGGPRFKILRGAGADRPLIDPALYYRQPAKKSDSDSASMYSKTSLDSRKEKGLDRGSSGRGANSKRRRAMQVGQAGGIDAVDDDDDSDDEDDEEEVVETQLREVTRFTVPKRDLQKKFETLQIEDLIDNEATIRKIQEYLSRQGRSVHVRRSAVEIRVPRTVGLNYVQGEVTFNIYTEAEEERSDTLEYITRINTTRQEVAREARIRDRQIRHQIDRERLS